MTKEIKEKAKFRAAINAIIDKFEVEETNDQEEVFSSTVGVSFDSRWYRCLNEEEIKQELVKFIANTKI